MIDLRSDTVSIPTQEMRTAMSNAPVGDDVYSDDPTVAKLEALAATLTGKEAGLFVPSGTMGNQLAIMAHTNRGDEIIVGHNSHITVHEVGGASVISQVSYRVVTNHTDTLSAAEVLASIREDDIHYPTTGLICLENALSNGTVVPLEQMAEVYKVGKEHGIPVHLDGARVFNAATYLNTDVKEITKNCDTVMFCVSKGLCAPVGSLLCGSAPFISKARKYRKLLGGGMRQAGIIAAAGIISLEKMVNHLKQDHENAAYMAKGLSKLPFIDIDTSKVHINIVFFKFNKNINHKDFVAYMLKNGVKINGPDADSYRYVTHHGITTAHIDTVLELMKNYF